ncbi:DUF6446 family protein [Litoreibacter janthinus]|uniref:Histidine kinase n=1 Tax=Litoreibacter janthinus TaxID=670154 RepID=A0A1I6HDY7_9RHOB|nr:DUF6446 family protein [Litoreibacter janthinus]SFR52706.1 hypothetical protein SAMN04488002_2890 [Litoreibacter janthinus]
MSGKLIGVAIMIIALIAGASLYYLQVYHFYAEVETPDAVELVSVSTGEPEGIIADTITAIDATSSPIRYRACFSTPMSHSMLTESYELADGAIPLTAPEWFDCFNAEEIGEALENGTALAFVGRENIEYGVDRIVAIFEDGRGYVWQQLNDCGQRAYDGTAVGPECPARPTESN